MREIVQSATGSACRVRFGGNGRRPVPQVDLSKWGERASLSMRRKGARHGIVKGSASELLLAGGGEADRYRRLDEGRFEYDVILDGQPRRPVISLALVFPDGLEFYRQQSLRPGERGTVVRDPFVEGSYAVYWRERNGRFGTGKFCHIYRPRLVDASGAWVWGALEYHDATLDILLPEQWLKRARYPVTVDPIVGSSSVGASYLIDDGGDWVNLRYELAMPVNRFQAPATLRGTCTAYYYCYYHDSEAAGIPAVYADSGGAPDALLSSDGELIDFDTSSGAWHSGTFDLADPIAAGDYLWFGAQARYQFLPYFDDGGSLSVMDTSGYSSPPASFAADWSESRILSMYFSYTASQEYSATVSDGVGVADDRDRVQALWRGFGSDECGVQSSSVSALSLLRRCLSGTAAADVIGRIGVFLRRRDDPGSPFDLTSRNGVFNRGLASLGVVAGSALRGVGIALRILDGFRLWDYLTNRALATYEVLTLSSRLTVELELDSRL